MGKILHLEVVDSVTIEVLGFRRELTYLLTKIEIGEIVTDGHTGTAALMSKYTMLSILLQAALEP